MPKPNTCGRQFIDCLASMYVEVPVDTVFDMKPGDIFVMRNAELLDFFASRVPDA